MHGIDDRTDYSVDAPLPACQNLTAKVFMTGSPVGTRTLLFGGVTRESDPGPAATKEPERDMH